MKKRGPMAFKLMDGWMDGTGRDGTGRTDGRMDRWMDGWPVPGSWEQDFWRFL